MNLFEFFATIERYNTILNPTSAEKLDLAIRYCAIRDGMRILDVGCGKGWLLRRLAQQFRHPHPEDLGEPVHQRKRRRLQPPLDPRVEPIAWVRGGRHTGALTHANVACRALSRLKNFQMLYLTGALKKRSR